MFEAIFTNRSVQFHRDMNYHTMDDDGNYSAKSLDRLVMIMLSDGALFDDSDDSSFSVTILNSRIVVGTGIMLNDSIFRIALNDGSIHDYGPDGNSVEYED